ncbi:hypothetical protein CONCODRAFT_78082 [Conidiobolus coronatus NRRL 28638]|uniref:SUN-domain-containing protein n=1 Tax=Conidiobolus coronatus (strain ATCC 28846 / CBS 209.66 / NRRL 28638) TaxID=796925 RepID=A0A137PA83_CONC2|nr:hypothetical protein CONCODRAFT_78082 [Conidiobolus coronatus NRRL 28638]|eukprot:KXN71916.1 hypothetical protein CONCODRAFT_78082 [Conidiobolus coronatus NRRL 28638]
MTRFINIIALSLLSLASIEAGKCKPKHTQAQAEPELSAPKLVPQKLVAKPQALPTSAYSVAPAPTTTVAPPAPATTTSQGYQVKPTGNPEIINTNGCNLPSDPNIVPITPGSLNKGWAMSPDQACKPGTWCPYACKPGMYSAQWSPDAKCPTGSGCNTMDGGLYCDANGQLSKPKPDTPYCVNGLQNAFIQNQLSGSVGVCQTVYPGNEAMLIPTVANAGSSQVILTTPQNYWLGTSAHYYVNFPGTDANDCIWGSSDKPVGNWAPMVVGANQGYENNSFIMANVNPEYVKQGFNTNSSFKHFKITLQCQGNGCNNDGCFVTSKDTDKMCVTTVPPGAKINFVLTAL